VAARERADAALVIGRPRAYITAIARAQYVLARVALATGDVTAAVAHLREAIASMAARGAAGDEARALLELADLLRAGGEASDAARSAARAHQLFSDLGLTTLAARAARLLA
jgi:hypothetical protein